MCVRACMCARMYVRSSDWWANSHQDTGHDRNTPTEHTNGTHHHRKREEHGQHGKPEYICMIAANEKKV